MPILNANGLHPLYSYQLLAYCAINYRLVRAILTHQTLEGFYAAMMLLVFRVQTSFATCFKHNQRVNFFLN